MAKSFRIITLGCKVNQYESAYLKESLIRSGCSQAGRDEKADIAIINTCIVTERASTQSRQAIRRAIRENPSGITAAVGCYAQVFPDELSRIEGVGFVAGNVSKGLLPEILFEHIPADGPQVLLESFSKGGHFDFLPVKGYQDRTRAFLKIQDGCEAFCSYCIVPFARGPSRSLDPPRVTSMLRSLSTEGFKEVVLTGINLGQYGADLGDRLDLKGLLNLIKKERLSLRIRLSSIEPNEVDRELVEMIGSEKWLCRHFHIPLQSGDDRLLRRMNRTYTATEFAALIEYIHVRIPDAAIGVDAMAGFPGEDENAFQNTYSLIRKLPVSYLHVFPFSPRKRTAAAGFPDRVDQKVIKERAAQLRALGQQKRRAFYESCLGKEFQVLTEGWHSEKGNMVKGLSDNYLPVAFPSSEPMENRLVRILMEKVGSGVVIGTLTEI